MSACGSLTFMAPLLTLFRWVQVVWCSGINNKRKATACLWLLCGSEEALHGWERLMMSTRESVRAPTSQRCNPSRSPCTCSEAPLLSHSAWRSLNDLQISLIFQGPKPFRVLPRRTVGIVLTLSLFLHYPPVDQRVQNNEGFEHV